MNEPIISDSDRKVAVSLLCWPAYLSDEVFASRWGATGDCSWDWETIPSTEMTILRVSRGDLRREIGVHAGRISYLCSKSSSCAFVWDFQDHFYRLTLYKNTLSSFFLKRFMELRNRSSVFADQVVIHTRESLFAMVHLKRWRRKRALSLMARVLPSADLVSIVWQYVT